MANVNIESFVDYLASLNTPDEMSFNMYKGDRMAAIQRREDLLAYLTNMQEIKPTRLFIGEAPGYKGCLVSGVPFTDEYTIMTNKFFEGVEYCMRGIPDYIPCKETSAKVVWGCLNKISQTRYPLMWNIYPFHPSTVDSSVVISSNRPNRTPTPQECEFGKHVLFELLDFFDIKQVYAVGRIAEGILKCDFPDIKYIRHPGHGGANEFRKAFDQIYKLTDNI